MPLKEQKEHLFGGQRPLSGQTIRPISKPGTVSVRVKALQDAYKRDHESSRPPTPPRTFSPFRLTSCQSPLSSTNPDQAVKPSLPSSPTSIKIAGKGPRSSERSSAHHDVDDIPSIDTVVRSPPSTVSSKHTPEKMRMVTLRESPSRTPLALTRQNSVAVFVKEDSFMGPQVTILPKEKPVPYIPRTLTRQNTKVVFVEKDYFTGPQIAVLPIESSLGSESTLPDDRGTAEDSQNDIPRRRDTVYRNSEPEKTFQVPEPCRVPRTDIVEQLDEMIDEALENQADRKAEDTHTRSRTEPESSHTVPEKVEFLQDRSRFTESPATVNSTTNNGSKFCQTDYPTGSKDFSLPKQFGESVESKKRHQRSFTMDPVPKNLASEPSVLGHPPTDKLELPKSLLRNQTFHSRGKSFRLDSIESTKANESPLNPDPIRGSPEKPRIERGHYNIYIGHQQDRSILTTPDPKSNTESEQKPDQDSREVRQPYLKSRRSNGSIRSTTSIRGWIPSLKWRWWKLVLVDIEPNNRSPSKTDTTPKDQEVGEGRTRVAAACDRIIEYDSEKELAEEILSALANQGEMSHDVSIFAEEIRTSRKAYTAAQSEKERERSEQA